MNTYEMELENRRRAQFGLPKMQVETIDAFNNVYTEKPNTNSDVWTIKLSNLFPDGETFHFRYSKANGVQSSGSARFEHGKTYYTTDSVLVSSLKNEGKLDQNTTQNKELYDRLGVSYGEEVQSCCGGRRIRLKAYYFDVKEV